MKNLNQYIKEKLIINKGYHDTKIVVKSYDELRKIIKDRYNKLGSGTKQDPIDFNDIDVSNLNSFCNNKYQGMFDRGLFKKTKFKYIDISNWDVSNVTDMGFMFCNCVYFNQDISKWDVSKVSDMEYMFYRCKKFNQDLSDWDVLNVRNKDNTFKHCAIKEEYKPKFK